MKRLISIFVCLFTVLAFVSPAFAHSDYQITTYDIRPVEAGAIVQGKFFYITPEGEKFPMFFYDKQQNNLVEFKSAGNIQIYNYEGVTVWHNKTYNQLKNELQLENNLPFDTKHRYFPPILNTDQNRLDLSTVEENLIPKNAIVTSKSPFKIFDPISNTYKEVPFNNYSKVFQAALCKSSYWIKSEYPCQVFFNQNMANVVGTLAHENDIKTYDIETKNL